MSSPSSDKNAAKDNLNVAETLAKSKKATRSDMVKSIFADAFSEPSTAHGIFIKLRSTDTTTPPKKNTPPKKKEVHNDMLESKWAATPEESNHQTSFTASAVDATLGISPPAEKKKPQKDMTKSKCEVPPTWINGFD